MKRGWAFAVVFAGISGASCGPCNPPPSGNDVEIRLGSNTLLWGRDIAQSSSYSWEGPTLNGVDLIGFSTPSLLLDVRYRSLGETIAAIFNRTPAEGPLVFRRRPELHVFDRDPRELYFTLAMQTDTTQWPAQMRTPTLLGDNATPFAVPAGVVIPYGTNGTTDIYPTHAEVSPVTWSSFWRFEAFAVPPNAVLGSVVPQSDWVTLPAPAVLPDGFGSIKALRSVELPECSGAVNIQSDVFGAFQGQIGSGISCRSGSLPSVCGGGSYAIFPSVVALNAMSYLNHVDPHFLTGASDQPLDLTAMRSTPVPEEEGVVGGVLVSGRIHASGRFDNTCGCDVEACDVDFAYDMQFALDGNGYFAVVPHRIRLSATNGSLCNGCFGLSGVKDDIRDLFENSVPNVAHNIAKDRQKIQPPTGAPDGSSCGSAFDCNSRVCSGGVCITSNKLPWDCIYDINEVGSSDYDVASACQEARGELGTAVLVGAQALGNLDATPLLAVVNDPTNWRCRTPSADEVTYECNHGKRIRGKCEFKVPGEMAIPEPDEVRVGFSELDNFLTVDPGTSTDPHAFQSTVAFLAAYGSGGSQAVQNICAPSRNATSSNFYNRYFATLSLGGLSCTTPPPPPLPPPKLACGCGFDADCATGDKCFQGACQNACVADTDCVSGACYGDIHLCQSPPTAQVCSQFPSVCFPWEECMGQGASAFCFEIPTQPNGYPD